MVGGRMALDFFLYWWDQVIKIKLCGNVSKVKCNKLFSNYQLFTPYYVIFKQVTFSVVGYPGTKSTKSKVKK